MGYSSRLSYRATKRFNNFKNHADRIINSNLTEHYMELDGVNEYINSGNDSSLNFERTDTFSISLWVNSAVAANNFLFSKQQGSSPFTGYSMTFNVDEISVILRNDTTFDDEIFITTTAENLSTDTWYHVLFTYSGNSLASGCTIYINGVSAAFTTTFDNLSSSITTANNFEIGRRSDGLNFNGNIDEMSIWDKELTQSEVTEIYNKGRKTVDYSDMSNYTANCVSHWAMGENNTWSGGVWSIPDEKGLNNASSVNMEYEDVKPTETVTTFGSLSGSLKWIGGVLANNGFIYGIPFNSTTILKINTETDTTTRFGSLSGTVKWNGGVLANNGFIYAIPRNSTTILKINTETDTATTFGSLSGTAKWDSGILAPNGSIYGIPRDSTTILKIDTNTDTISTFGSLSGSATKWSGGVLAPNGIIYGIPLNSTTILKIDTNTDTISTFGSLAGSLKWTTAVLTSNGIIYGIPYNSTTILKIDTNTDTISTFGSLAGSGKWVGGVLSSNGIIYGIPYDSTTILKIDTNTDTTTTFGSLTGVTKWQGGIIAPNGSIYGIPVTSTTILKIDTNITNGFDENFLMSGYYNKF